MTASHDVTRTRVLIIDDDISIGRMLKEIVASLGYSVRTTSRFEPSDAEDLNEHDFVFIDMMMPGTDGIQVLDALSRNQVKSSIVLMSGTHREVLTAAETIARRTNLNVTGVLNKPFRSTEIRELLSGRHGGDVRPQKTGVVEEIGIAAIEAALDRHEFDIHLQPIIALQTSLPIGYEALARWRSPSGIIAPDRFISVAAKNGILPRLTKQILKRALARAAELKARGLVWNVWVNFSAEDFADEDLPEFISRLLAENDLPANSLTIELTESSATANEVTMLSVLSRLRLKDFNLAIDDFGTSYSNLERVSVVPFTFLKIDKHFIAGLFTNPNARAIVESAIALGKRLGMRVVAEGIETPEQLQAMRTMGCDYAQGFLISRPMEFADLVNWAERHDGNRLAEAVHQARESATN